MRATRKRSRRNRRRRKAPAIAPRADGGKERAARMANTSASTVEPAAVHVPIRQCVGCRVRSAKKSLVRFVRTPGGGWQADPAAQLAGRGAYVCSATCKETLKKNKRYRGLVELDWPEEMVGR